LLNLPSFPTRRSSDLAYFVSALAPDLSVVRFARYSADFIPRNAPVLADVDDINNNIGFWRPQADFRIPERLSPGFTNFPDVEIRSEEHTSELQSLTNI